MDEKDRKDGPIEIVVDTNIDPRTDINSPDFDMVYWQEEIRKNKPRYDKTIAEIKKQIEQFAADQLSASLNQGEAIQMSIDFFQEIIKDIVNTKDDQLPGQTSLEGMEPAHADDDGPTISAKKAAEIAGALTTIGERQLSITDKKYQYALTPKRNNSAFISVFDTDFMEKLVFENGQLSILKSGVETATIKKATRDGLKPVKDLDLPLLRQLCTAAYTTATAADSNTITVYLPSFCREMGIDIQSGKASDLFSKMDVFKNCVGVLDNGSYWKLFEILGYDKDKNTLTFATPYINRLFISIARSNKKEFKGGKSYISPAYCWLMHSSVVSERNKPAVEVANRIIAGLQQRGSTPDAGLKQNKNRVFSDSEIVSYSVSFKRIIDDTPILKDRIDSLSSSSDKNKIIKRAFTGAYKILRTKTDAYKYYLSLFVPETIPTMSTLDIETTITHRGINGDYGPPKHGELS